MDGMEPGHPYPAFGTLIPRAREGLGMRANLKLILPIASRPVHPVNRTCVVKLL